MRTRVRLLILAGCACAVTSMAAGAPAMLRRIDSFNVQRVEIRGTKYLAPYDALVQTGITRTSNVFDDFAPWKARLLRHPMVLHAQIERALPGTIKVEIAEAEPIALIRTPDLRVIDARARVLPIDPAAMDLDLPVLSVPARPDAQGYFKDEMTRDVIRMLDTLREKDPRLYSWISEVSPSGNRGMMLRLRQPNGARVLLPANPRDVRLHELEVALADLSVRGELHQLQSIDARFRDQIVVSLKADERN